MDFNNFSSKLAEVTKNLTSEERASLKKIFKAFLLSCRISKKQPQATPLLLLQRVKAYQMGLLNATQG